MNIKAKQNILEQAGYRFHIEDDNWFIVAKVITPDGWHYTEQEYLETELYRIVIESKLLENLVSKAWSHYQERGAVNEDTA